jgi:hypothetical protein
LLCIYPKIQRKIQKESREVKGKQTQLNAYIESLPKRERWAIEYKRHAMEYKRELTKHAKSLRADDKGAVSNVREARTRKDVGSKAYNEMQKGRKCELGSYLNRKETIYRKNGMKHEHYHGGQFNGVSCRQQMSTATQFCKDWL